MYAWKLLIFEFKICLSGAVTPRVAIIMGSDSDLPTMKDAAEILKNFGVPHEVSFITMLKPFFISRCFVEGVIILLCTSCDFVNCKITSGNNCFSSPNTRKDVLFCIVCKRTRYPDHNSWCWWCSTSTR